MNANLVPQNTGRTEDRWLSVEEIAEYLGVAKASMYRWIEGHGMPAHHVGRLWKFKRSEVDEWVRSGGATDKTRVARTSRWRKSR